MRSGNVYSANPNGGARRWVTSGVSPDWSPNGRRLALVRPLPSLTFDDPIGRMYTVAASGRDLRRVGRSKYRPTRSGRRTVAGSHTTGSTSAST